MTRITLKDVAARAGVSYQTVSKVLNHQAQVSAETEERIWQAVEELHYRPNVSARNLRTRATNLIGYAWHFRPAEPVHPILDAFIHSVAVAAEAHGFYLLTFIVPYEEPSNVTAYRTLFAHNQVSGFVIANTVRDDPRIRQLIDLRLPFVAFGRANPAWDFHWVDVDGEYGIRIAADHLLACGHRRIGLITWPEGSQTGWYREQGYLRALRGAGVEPHAEWIFRGEHSAHTGARGLRALMDLPAGRRPTALLCVSDEIAIGAMSAAQAAGIQVGRDLAITGFDDTPLAAYANPPLTSVSQPIAAVGRHAVDLLVGQINGRPLPDKSCLLEPELIVRASSGAAPHRNGSPR